MDRTKVLLGVAGAAALAAGVVAGPASATPAQQRIAVQRAVGPAASGCSITAYHYTGTARCGSHAMGCDWNGSGNPDEVFVIAPSGTIWHAWPNSGGWKEMPNNGKAWDTWNCYWNGDGQRQVEVETSAANVYYSYYNGAWRGWYKY